MRLMPEMLSVERATAAFFVRDKATESRLKGYFWQARLDDAGIFLYLGRIEVNSIFLPVLVK